MPVRKLYLIAVIFFVFNTIEMRVSPENLVKETFNRLFHFKTLPITLFPHSKSKDLKFLSRGLKLNYYVPPRVSKVEFTTAPIFNQNNKSWFFKKLKVHFDPFLIKNLKFEKAYLEFKNLIITRERKIKKFSKAGLLVSLNADNVSEYATKECAKYNYFWPRFKIVNNRIKLYGKLKVAFFNMKIYAEGMFKLRNQKNNIYVCFSIYKLKAGFLPVPSFLSRKLIAVFNPLFKIDFVPLNIKLKKIYIDGNSLVLYGESM